jgi:acyl dehydratase
MGIELDFVEPIRVGDRLRSETRIAEVFVKPIRLDESAVWIVSETVVFNQINDVVARLRNTVLVHRTPGQIAEDSARTPI